MNRKLQELTDEMAREVRARFPDFVLEVQPRGRKSAYIYMIAPDSRIWADADIWDIVDEIARKQLDTLIKGGYSILLLPHQPLSPPTVAAASAMLREKSPEWNEQREDEAQ